MTGSATTGVQAYLREEVISFRRTSERFGGLSNMAAGFPLVVNGARIGSSEALYQACRFPHLPEVQKLILDERSPMKSKMLSRTYGEKTCPDWDPVRVPIMAWCLRVKLAEHWVSFGNLLLATGESSIVEDSRHDDFWGAKMLDDHRLVGRNVLGCLLMELRGVLMQNPETLRRVVPPSIDQFTLLRVFSDWGCWGQAVPLASSPSRRSLASLRGRRVAAA